MRPLANVQLVGVVVQWASALLLLAVFLLLRRDATGRRPVGIWVAAWTAYAVATGPFALEGLILMAGGSSPSPLIAGLLLLYWPAVLVYPLLVLGGAITLIQQRVPSRHVWGAALVVVLLGLIVPLSGQEHLASRIRDVLSPTLLFGGAILLLVRAEGTTRRGLAYVGLALALHATLSTIYLLDTLGGLGDGILGHTLATLAVSAGFGDAIALVILGTAVILLMVEDSFAAVDRAREERLRGVAASEARLTRIIAAAGEAIITVDAAERIEMVNPAAERLFAGAAQDFLGRRLDEFLLDRDTARRLDGTRFPVEVTIGPLHHEGAGGSVVIVRDLTQQEALEADREQLDRRLAESEKMMAIGRIVSGVAHELNNPLAVVLGQSEQLVAETADGEVRDGLQLINEQANRARHIVKDLLAFVRPREEQRTAFPLEPVVVRAVSAVSRNTEAGRATLDVLGPGVPVEVMGDPMAVEQVIVNLVDNALDAAGPGGVVRVRYRSEGAEVVLVVEDTGPGVPEHEVTRLFEPFFTTKPAGEGTGLGLPVSLGLVEQQGGTLRFENRPGFGIGARFVVTLPQAARTQELPVASSRHAAIFPGPPSRGATGPAEVLLVDDEAAVRATLGRMFRRSGWAVRECSSGDEALALLLAAEGPALPALILCDLKMPGMGGQQLHEQLARHRPEVLRRMAFVTGDVVAETTSRFLAECECPVVEKPFTIAEVAAVVERLVHQPA